MDKQSHHLSYSCPNCEQTFKRPDHLNRHLVSHSDLRPFGCSFCELRFGRRDALLRHWRTCQHRAQADDAPKEPQRQKRGRKRLSCDQCVKAKRKCTRRYPCNACERLSLPCNLSKSNPRGGAEVSCKIEAQDFDVVSPTIVSIPFETDACDEASPSYDALIQRDVNMLYNAPYSMAGGQVSSALQSPELTHAFLPIPEATIYPAPSNSPPSLQLLFLEHFTQTSGFASSFDCGNPIQRAQILRKLTAIPIRPPSIPWNDGKTTELIEQEELCHAPSNGIACYDSVDAVEPHRPGSMSCCWSCHPLFQKSEEIVQGIRKVVSKRFKDAWTPEVEQECRHFFAPPQVEKFLVAFFALWYPNVPTFHKPGFVAAQKPATLVAALSLIGASLTSDDTERQGSWRWIMDVEEFVFQDDAFSDLQPGVCSMDESWMFRLEPRLDALRAAYSIVLFLQWEGNEEQRHRARHVRFPQAISVARSILTLGPIRHRGLSNYLEPFHNFLNWKRFILKEEYIRTVLYVFLLDCAFKMFNNCSPRMTIDELNIGLTCPEVCFQASRIDEWKQYMDVWAASKTGKDLPIFRDVVSFICKEELSLDEWNILCEMSSLNFFTLANVFQNLIYQYHQPASRAFLEAALSAGSGPTPILNALANWKRTWLCRQTILGDYDVYQVGAGNAWRRVGFFRHCFEFWRFALMVYRQLESTGWLERFDSFMEKDDMTEVHDLIARFQNVNIGEFDL